MSLNCHHLCDLQLRIIFLQVENTKGLDLSFFPFQEPSWLERLFCPCNWTRRSKGKEVMSGLRPRESKDEVWASLPWVLCYRRTISAHVLFLKNFEDLAVIREASDFYHGLFLFWSYLNLTKLDQITIIVPKVGPILKGQKWKFGPIQLNLTWAMVGHVL